MTAVNDLKVKIFADGADVKGMVEMYAKPFVKGFTTNPTLMRKAGITDYRGFAKEVLAAIPDRPISFEVFSDDFAEMERQAQGDRELGQERQRQDPGHEHAGRARVQADPDARERRASSSTSPRCSRSSRSAMSSRTSMRRRRRYVSVFAGRIADTGVDPLPLMAAAHALVHTLPHAELIWALAARAAQRVPRRLGRLRHHHGHERRAREAVERRQGPRAVLARDREDVPRRRVEGRLQALSDARLRRDVVWNLIPVVLLAAVGLGSNFAIFTWWDSEALAVFNLVTTAFFVLAVLGACGLQYSVLRAVAEAPDDPGHVASVVVGALVPNLVLAAAVTVLFVALRGPFVRAPSQRCGRRGHARRDARPVLLLGQQGLVQRRQRAAPDARLRDLHVAALRR